MKQSSELVFSKGSFHWMKMHKSLSNIFVVLWGQGLYWPLWAIMLFFFFCSSGVQSSFYQGKSLFWVTTSSWTSHLIYCAHSTLNARHGFLGTLGDSCSSMKSLEPLAPLAAPPLWVNAGWWHCSKVGDQWQWLEWRASRKTMLGCIGGSRVTFELGRGPIQFISSAQMDFWEIAVIPEGGKSRKSPVINWGPEEPDGVCSPGFPDWALV